MVKIRFTATALIDRHNIMVVEVKINGSLWKYMVYFKLL
jgi:hypothetical protein